MTSLYILIYTCAVLNKNTAAPARNSKPVWIYNVACSGTELTLLECNHESAINKSDHSQDIGVHCQQREFICKICGR